MIGKTISHYKILAKLGEGGMGVVYKAEDIKLKRYVALKYLPHHLSISNEDNARLLNEAQMTAKLNHPHICTIYDIEEADEEKFIVMEFVDGVTLREKIRKNLLSIDESINYAIQIGEALEEAHSQGIIHRDIKPDNIMINNKNQIKVMDFGIAKLKEGLGVTQTMSTSGTVSYMAPEQLSNSKIDGRVDIFSLGILLYEMLSSRLPFRGEHQAAMMYSIMNEEPEPINKYLSEVPSEMLHTLNRALEKDPEDRYQNVHDMVIDLRRLKKGTTKIMGSMTNFKTTEFQSHRSGFNYKRLILAGFISLAVIIIGVASFIIYFNKSEKLIPNRVAVAAFDNQTEEKSLDSFGTLLTESLIQGIASIREVNVVPAEESKRIWQRLMSYAEPSDLLLLFGEETKAKFIITGSFYKQGDSLLIHAQVTDSETGKHLKVMRPIGRALDKKLVLIELVKQRLMGAIDFLFDRFVASLYYEVTDYFPTHDAYLESVAGGELFVRGNYAEAINHFKRSFAIDSTYTGAFLYQAWAYYNSGIFPVADSICQILYQKRSTLNKPLLLILRSIQALLQGDNLTCLETARKIVLLAPKLSAWQYFLGLQALRTNYLNEAVNALSKINETDTTHYHDWVYTWWAKTFAYHLLGKHEEELKEALKGRTQLPNRIETISNEMNALVALGRIEDTWKRFDEICALPVVEGSTPGQIMTTMANELRFHGFRKESLQAIDKAIKWYTSRPIGEQQKPSRSWALADIYYLAGRWKDAKIIYQKLLNEYPNNITLLGRIGAIAARIKDTTQAKQIVNLLRHINRPYIRGVNTYWCARITSLLGEKEQALTLLREALSQGQSYYTLHAVIDLEPLKDYPPFQELIKPK